MSPRPRKASDDDVFAAATAVMGRRGPAQMTLADIADAAGLTAGALVQRFGSKRGLLLALWERFADGATAMFAGLRASHSSPLAAIYAYGTCMARMGDSPAAVAHHLAWLQQDLTDPDFRRFTVKQARATRRELVTLVRDAVAANELAATVDVAAIGRAIEVMVSGSLMTWAVHQEGTATSWVRHDLDVLFAPLRPARQRAARPAAPRAVRRCRPR